MKNTEKLSFDQLDQEIEVLTLKASKSTLGGMTIDDLTKIVNTMEANGISSLTSNDQSTKF